MSYYKLVQMLQYNMTTFNVALSCLFPLNRSPLAAYAPPAATRKSPKSHLCQFNYPFLLLKEGSVTGAVELEWRETDFNLPVLSVSLHLLFPSFPLFSVFWLPEQCREGTSSWELFLPISIAILGHLMRLFSVSSLL